MKGSAHKFEMEMAAEMRDLRQLIMAMTQAAPNVSGKASALVALAKDARLDGRVGAGDVVVSVGLAAGGLAIGVIGAAGVRFGSASFLSTGEIFSLATLGGCGLGIIRLSLDALALPMLWSESLDWLAGRHESWLENKYGDGANKPESTREIPVYSLGESVGFVSMPEPTEFKVKTKKIPSTNMVDGIREIPVDKLCLFLKSAVATGNWAREKQDILSQKEHPDVKAYFAGKGWWEISAPPALRLACAQLRGGVTNGTERTGTNG